MSKLLTQLNIGLFLAVSFLSSFGCYSQTVDKLHTEIRVTFIIPDKEGPLFWQLVKDISASVSTNLGVKFNYIHTDSDRFAMQSVLKKLIAQGNKPDYLIFRPFKGNSEKMFALLEQHQLPFVTIERAFSGNEALRLGVPQQKYRYWLGQVNYDNVQGGKLLTEALIKAYQQQHPSKSATIIGIGGDFDSVSLERQQYLENLSEVYGEQFVVKQIFPMYWNPAMVKDRLPAIQNRYPNVPIYFSAGDQMAFEVIDFYKQNNKPIPIVGGFDWLPAALDRIHQNEMTASVGGHFLVAAQALLKIVDYHHGFNRFNKNAQQYHYELITHDNVIHVRQFLNDKKWQQIDYHKFLFMKNKQAPKALTIQALLDIAAEKPQS